MCDPAQELLAWYDTHARVMPWRVGPVDRLAGRLPDPYQVWLSEVMLQQTTVAAVKDYFRRFVTRWPTVVDLAAARDDDVMAAWAGLGYYARARNLLKCARVVAFDLGGRFPDTQEELLKLPGIGPYTAAALAAIAFDRPATVLDGNVERVMARVHAVHKPLPASKEDLRALARDWTPVVRPGDYAQAVMDLGATICTPRKPACGLCVWRPRCKAHKDGNPDSLPKKAPKTRKPVRKGVVLLVTNAAGDVVLERRPDKGLLGGMLGFPGSVWSENPVPFSPPDDVEWDDLSEFVRHTFTHFHLHLSVKVAKVSDDYQPTFGFFVPRSDFRPSALPTVMRKVWDLNMKAVNEDRG